MFDLTQPWQTGRFAAFDTETTGTDPRSSRIIEFGLVIFENGEVVERFQTLIHPECALPAEITRITGIKDEDLVGKPVFAELADELERRLVAQPLLAYNADFDRGMVEGEFRRLGRSIALPVFLDPFPFCHEAFKVAKKTKTAKLVDIAAFLGISLESAHRADHDAEAAGRVMLALPGHIALPASFQDLLAVQAEEARRVAERFARFRRGKESDNNTGFGQKAGTIELGAAYVYGEETDPVKALFARIPDVRHTGPSVD
jgi:DNA polymerase III epsilon subunit family exonuclease